MLEGDSEVIMKALMEDRVCSTSLNPRIQDAKFFTRSFSQLLYSHTMRECNKLTYCLARNYLTVSDCVILMEDISSQFYFVFQIDIAGFY